MKRLYAIVALGLLPALLQGCGKGQPESNSYGVYYPPYQNDALNFDEGFAQASVSCAKSEECPTTAGLVYIFEKKLVDYYGVLPTQGQCSGTLVRGDVVLMNSHCVPDSVKQSPELCSQHLGFVQANTQEHVRCSKLLYFSDISDTHKKTSRPDYALMRLERPLTQSPVTINVDGIKDMEELTAYVSDPNSEYSVAGLIRKKTCLAVMNSILAPDFVHAKAKVVSLFGDSCKVIGGNSGSGLRNARNELVAVVSHKGNVPSSVLSNYQKIDFSLASNLACLDLSSIGDYRFLSCQDLDADALFQQNLTKNVEQNLQSMALEKVKGAPNIFKYRVKFSMPKSDLQSWTPVQVKLQPECVVPIDEWRSKQRIQKRSIDLFSSEYFVSLEFAPEKEYIKLGLDKYLRVGLESDGAGGSLPSYAELRFSKKENDFVLRGQHTAELSLSVCTPFQLQSPVVIE